MQAAASSEEVSPVHPDWSREVSRSFWDPSRRLLRSIRAYQAARARTSFAARISRKWWKWQHLFWSVVTQAEVQLDTRLGGGLLMPHPNGVVIHPEAVIGPNCLIFQQVTIGTRTGSVGAPRIGGHVDIGAGARILGGVRIGDHAVIGANAVVVHDVPPRSLAVGVPARILSRS